MSDILLHICTREAWDEAQRWGDYRADSLDSEGFIHCSTPAQVVGTANLLFRGQTGLVLLVIDADRLTAPIRYEDAGERPVLPARLRPDQPGRRRGREGVRTQRRRYVQSA